MMNEYVVMKYVQDEVRKEAVNIGVVLKPVGIPDVYTKFYEPLNKILIINPKANIGLIENFISYIKIIKSGDPSFLKKLVARFQHQIQFSEIMLANGEDPEKLINLIYERFISLEPIDPGQIVAQIKERFNSKAVTNFVNLLQSKDEEALIELGIKMSPESLSKEKRLSDLISNKEEFSKFVSMSECVTDSGGVLQ